MADTEKKECILIIVNLQLCWEEMHGKKKRKLQSTIARDGGLEQEELLPGFKGGDVWVGAQPRASADVKTLRCGEGLLGMESRAVEAHLQLPLLLHLLQMKPASRVYLRSMYSRSLVQNASADSAFFFLSPDTCTPSVTRPYISHRLLLSLGAACR